jgi:hypothetical protein
MPRAFFSRAVQSSQGAFQFVNLALVVNLLPLGQLQRFQHIFHFVEGMFQFLDDLVDLFDGLGNGGNFRAALALGLRFRSRSGLRLNWSALNSLSGRGRCGRFNLFKILSSRFGVFDRPTLCGGNFGRVGWLRFTWALASSGVAATSTPRAAARALARRRGGLFGSRFRLFVRNHADNLPGEDPFGKILFGRVGLKGLAGK